MATYVSDFSECDERTDGPKNLHTKSELIRTVLPYSLQVSELYQSIGTQTRAPVGPKSTVLVLIVTLGKSET